MTRPPAVDDHRWSTHHDGSVVLRVDDRRYEQDAAVESVVEDVSMERREPNRTESEHMKSIISPSYLMLSMCPINNQLIFV